MLSAFKTYRMSWELCTASHSLSIMYFQCRGNVGDGVHRWNVLCDGLIFGGTDEPWASAAELHTRGVTHE